LAHVAHRLMIDPFARLAGGAPTNNPFFSRRDVTHNSFVSSKLWVVEPCDLWVDEAMPLKFDYDYTMQHLFAFGDVCRVDAIVTDYDSGKLKGGCQEYRTNDLERSMVRRLMHKYPDNITVNTRRGDTEVRLRWKGGHAHDRFATTQPNPPQ
jgi:hypothetical protein